VAIVNGGKDVIERKTSIGRPLPILDVVIADPDGKELPDGQLGEILIYGPTITPGYWNRPDATAETVRDGWLHTGDLGYRDSEGFYFVVDRAKDMIIPRRRECVLHRDRELSRGSSRDRRSRGRRRARRGAR
jgi:acyl-CoA synthetase (AMP-forming)/AMP-acid ligase II